MGGGKSESRECAEWNDTAGPAGVGACGWRKGCRDGLRSAAGARWWGSGEGLARSGLVQIGLAGGHFEMVRFAVGGLAGCDVVTELSQAVRNMVGRREIR